MSNNGERFLSIDYSNYHVYIWKRNSRSVLHALRWSSDRPRAGRMTPDGKIAIIGFYARNGLSNDIRIVNADTGSEILALNGHLNNTYEVVIDELGQRFATRGDDNRVRVWEVKTGKEVLSITAANQPRRIQINDDGSLIALSYQVSSSYTLEIWDINQKKKLYSTTDSRIYVPDAMTFHRTASILAVARSRNIYTWDFKNNVIATFTQSNSGNTLTRLQYSFDGEFLAAARHQEMLIYSTQNQKLLETLPLGSSPTGLSFAKDGKTILVSASDRRIHLFECPCKAGNTRQCYTQPFGNPGKGICKYGTQTCKPDSSWGACTGDTSAQVETSDGTDQDCNGYIDDPFADLKVQTITATPSSLKVGDTTAIQVCITNVGNANSESLPAKVRLYLGLNNADIPNSAQKLTDNTPQATYQDLSFGSIKAGAQTCQTISIKLPFIFPGTRYIGAFVDHDKQVTETDENNNITHTPITVVP
jgi:WD40 repeat protein